MYAAHLQPWGRDGPIRKPLVVAKDHPNKGMRAPPQTVLLWVAPNTLLCAFSDHLPPAADEPTSPKKAKSIPKHHDLESWFSHPSPEWATVTIIPEEEMTEHNLLAIRVMVTSDTSRYFKIQVSV